MPTNLEQIESRIAKLNRHEEVLSALGDRVGEELRRNSPGPPSQWHASGLLRERIKITEPIADLDDVGIGVGPFKELGNPNRKAPKGTIAEYIRDHPEARDRSQGAWGGRMAWWSLADEDKANIDELRESGRYGGSQDGKIVPAYWSAHQEGRVPGVNSTIGYVTEALDAVRPLGQRLMRGIFE